MPTLFKESITEEDYLYWAQNCYSRMVLVSTPESKRVWETAMYGHLFNLNYFLK